MTSGRHTVGRPPLDRRTSALASLVAGSAAATLGVAHALATTQGTVVGYALVALVFLSLFGVAVYLLSRFALVIPALVLSLLVVRTFTFSPTPPTVDGPYPGLVLAWPVLLGVLLVLAGGERLARGLLFRAEPRRPGSPAGGDAGRRRAAATEAPSVGLGRPARDPESCANSPR